MTVKQIEKISTKVFTIHQENLEYWSRLDKDVTKTVDSVLNHREQIEMFSKLDINRLEVCQEFPDVKDALLQKLSNLTLQFETKLLEFSDTFSKQNEALQKLSSRCLEESSSVEQSTVIETKPGESSLAEKIESCYKLSMLYNSIDTGLTTWMECRHSDRGVWNIKDYLGKINILL